MRLAGLRAAPLRRRHKYGAKATVVDGIRFASKKEANRYGELKLLERAGHIKDLELQPSFDLIVVEFTVRARLKEAAARIAGRAAPKDTRHKVGVYRADFRYRERALSESENDRTVVEDVKGVKTAVYKLKKRMVEAQYGIEIVEV